jgi:drug/metabolite transporter (DMT)-like permease
MSSEERGGQALGVVLVALGAVMLSSKGIFAKVLYARGLDYETVVAVRAVLAVPGFFALAWWSGQSQRLRAANTAHFAWAAAGGLACYYLGAMANFYALTLIDASIERALLYTYPAMIVLALWVLHRDHPPARLLAAIGLTAVGIVLTVGALNRDLPAQDPAGVLWVLFCSATIAFYFILTSRLAVTFGAANFTAIAMTSAGAAFLMHYQIRAGWENLDMNVGDWGFMLTLVVFATVLPLFFTAEGLRRIGAQRAAVSSTIAPATAVLMAVTLLGETVTISQLLGILLIILGILALELRRKVPVVT